jgi:predicted nucleic acid-binding protein
MRLYLDACTVIYAVEGQPDFRDRVRTRLSQLRLSADSEVVTSRLSRMECRVRPLREKNAEILAEYDVFFSMASLRLIDVSEAVIETATDFRARYGFETPDAIHLATAALNKVAETRVPA